MQKLLLIAVAALFLLPSLAGSPRLAAAQAGDASSLIAEVNALRASYGLAPYEVDFALMAAAQAHSEYQAEIGTWTHTGAGGTRPHDRAVAAGYGGGAQVYISENVAMGVELTSSQVVYQMWQDAIHLETMISSRYRHIGAGVASNGNHIFFTIDVGFIEGSPGGGDGDVLPGGTPSPGDVGPPGATENAVVPIELAKPRPDGSITHVVQWGQFMENIANAYEVPLNDLLALNGLNQDTIIYEGDKLLVKIGATSGSTSEPTRGTPVAETGVPDDLKLPATATVRVDRTVAPVLARAAVALPGSPQPVEIVTPVVAAISPPASKDSGPDYLLIAVFGLAVTGTAMVLLGSALKRAGS